MTFRAPCPTGQGNGVPCFPGEETRVVANNLKLEQIEGR